MNHSPSTESSSVSRKLRVLVAAWEAQGLDTDPQTIEAELSREGVRIEPGQWEKMLQGTILPACSSTLHGIAEHFGVNPRYLLTDGEHARRVEAQLGLLAALKRNKVKNFAVQQLGDVGAETIERIRRLLDEGPEAA